MKYCTGCQRPAPTQAMVLMVLAFCLTIAGILSPPAQQAQRLKMISPNRLAQRRGPECSLRGLRGARDVHVSSEKLSGRRRIMQGLTIGTGIPLISGALPSLPSGVPFSSLQLAEAMTRLSTDEASVVKMFEMASSSVVYITSFKGAQDALTLQRSEFPTQAGSGFIWDKDGHVVTNLHVVEGADEVQVTFMGSVSINARLVGADPDTDLAVLKLLPDPTGGSTVAPAASLASVKPSGTVSDGMPEGKVGQGAKAPTHKSGQFLKPILFGDSKALKVGQSVYAIGNPFGLDHTLTRGIVSGIARDMQSPGTGRFITDIIQTDAAINPGNSGGPLLDSEGRIIGVNTALLSPSGAFAGVGFALPIDLVRNVVNQLLNEGKVQRAVLGAILAPDRIARSLGIDAGLLVLQVVPGSPAARAGLRPTIRDEYGRPILGDIILGANGSKVTQSSDFYRVVNKLGVGDQVDLEVLRKSDREQVSLRLASSKAIEDSINEARMFLLKRENMDLEVEVPEIPEDEE